MPSEDLQAYLLRLQADQEAATGASSGLREQALADYQGALNGSREPNYGAMIGQALAGAIPTLVGMGMGGATGLESGAAAGSQAAGLAYQQQQTRDKEEDSLKQLIAKLKLDRAVELDKDAKDARKELGKATLDVEKMGATKEYRDSTLAQGDRRLGLEAQRVDLQGAGNAESQRHNKAMESKTSEGNIKDPLAGNTDPDVQAAVALSAQGMMADVPFEKLQKVMAIPGGLKALSDLNYSGGTSKNRGIRERRQERDFSEKDSALADLEVNDPSQKVVLSTKRSNDLTKAKQDAMVALGALKDLKVSYKNGVAVINGQEKIIQAAANAALFASARSDSMLDLGKRLEGPEAAMGQAYAASSTTLDGITKVTKDYLANGAMPAEEKVKVLKSVWIKMLNARLAAIGNAKIPGTPSVDIRTLASDMGELTADDLDAELGEGL